MTAPADARTTQALADLEQVRRAAVADGLPTGAAVVLQQLLDDATAAAAAGEPFVIELEQLAADTGLTHAAVATALADLFATGWIARGPAGWQPALPVPAATRAARPKTPRTTA